MIEFLIDKYSLKKLTLFNLIYRNSSLQNTYLAEELDISPRSVNRYIHALNDEITNLYDLDEFFQFDGLTYYKIDPKFSNQDALDIFYLLKLHYLKTSLSFNLIVKLGTEERTNFENLTTELSISSSYLLRIIKSTSTHLEKFGFEIEIDKFNKVFFHGNEKKIRAFLFSFLTDSFQTIEWPFKNISRFEIHKMRLDGYDIPQNEFDDARIDFLIALISIRVSNKRFVTNSDSYISGIVSSLAEEENSNSLHVLTKFLDGNKNLPAEVKYYNFMVAIFISNTISSTKQQQIGKQLYNNDHELIVFCKGLIQEIETTKDIRLDLTNKYIELYKYTLFYTLILDFELDLGLLLTLTFPTPNYNLKIKNTEMDRVENLYNEYLIQVKVSPTLKNILENEAYLKFAYSITYNFWQSFNKPSLHIYIQVMLDFTAKDYIKKRISSLFNPENITFTQKISNAELIISDTLEKSQSLPVFFIYDLQSRLEWDKLTDYIQELLLDKLFEQE
ncbi:helix-turn-helix domain-containing protein [Listeria seeligeri]|uniref:helix-turn-helix domain-containing protein n=1 Tax=Listeria seeligeri TaxID=1640 RepID=UPI0010F06E67|nr:helix-turn-helix domain-containing protein [Listeria seeligeri]MBC1581464.1 hypothetical protein [Listeria seeligeri]